MLSPVVVLDSSAWGQVDGVFTFFLLLVCYLCMEEKRIFAYFAFVAGVLIKPQMIMFAPLLIWTIIEQVFLKDFQRKNVSGFSRRRFISCGNGCIYPSVWCGQSVQPVCEYVGLVSVCDD